MKDILKTLVFAGLFAIPFVTLYVENDYFFPFITGKNFAFRIIVEVVFALWVLLALLDRRYRPRFSWITAAFGALIAVMFASSAFAIHPATSFFSNFERMDGFITLVHVFLLTLVMGSVFTEKRHWRYFIYTTLTVAFFVALHGLAQFAGVIDGYRGRIDGRLGNAAYMAIYMLFHIFLAFWMFVESRSVGVRLLMTGLAAMFIFTLVETGTRGTTLGLFAGIGVMVTYVAIFGAQFAQFRKYAIGALVFLVVAFGALSLARDSAFVTENPNLARIASVTSPERVLQELEIRFVIWGMALEGVQERPLLGWGQGNFNYVFNQYYQPELYGQEQWFDRVHNIVLDWLIAGGVLGFLAYASIFVAALYYLVWRPWRTKDESFTVLERGVILGILAGYVTHNLVVFDNIVSYIFFAVVLAVIVSRVGKPIAALENARIDERLVTQFAAPLALVVVVFAIYTLHVPSMQAAADIIDSYRSQSPQDQLAAYKRALSRDSFGQQEVVEQLAQQAMNIARTPSVPENIRTEFVTLAETELLAFVETKPGDARLHVFLGSFYRSINQLDKAAEHMAIARELSPLKQAIIAQQGIIELTRGNNAAARDYFKEAFLLDERNMEAREYYAAALFLNREPEAARALVIDDAVKARFASSDFLVNAVHGSGDLPFLAELFALRIEADQQNAQNWASLAFVHFQLGNRDQALATLKEGGEKIPSFAPTARCIAGNIESGRDPQTPCES
jgi:O-antigen ligase/tetratricopeptide (TPR) repeat protein